MALSIVPNLWFTSDAEEAVAFYLSVFEDGRVLQKTRYPKGSPGPEGEVMTVEFELRGQKFVAINGGVAEFPFSEAISLMIECADQAEVDRFWERLTEGGEEGHCGWLKDRFGLSWQVVPLGMDDVFADPDPTKAERAMAAMLTMRKLDVATLKAAAESTPVA